MSMLSIHEEARESYIALLHEFLGTYNRKSKIVYAFVEGPEDVTFYKGAILNKLPSDWECKTWFARNKQKVIQIYRACDWRRCHRLQVLFFIDRDLTPFLGGELLNQINVYITDGYSIENYFLTRHTCERVVNEVCALHAMDESEKTKVLNLFEQQLHVFRESLVPIMVWIIFWQKMGKRPVLNNIKMDHLFNVHKGKVEIIQKPQGLATWDEYIHVQCNIALVKDTDLKSIQDEFILKNGAVKFIRGKYLLWFLIKFVLSVHGSPNHFSTKVIVSPKMHTALGYHNAMEHISHLVRLPLSLNNFLNKTCVFFSGGLLKQIILLIFEPFKKILRIAV